MFKKIVEFFTGKKSEVVTTPTVSAPYKLEPPAAETTPPVTVLISPEVEPVKKKRTFVKKPAAAPVSKKPTKPRAKKTTQ